MRFERRYPLCRLWMVELNDVGTWIYSLVKSSALADSNHSCDKLLKSWQAETWHCQGLGILLLAVSWNELDSVVLEITRSIGCSLGASPISAALIGILPNAIGPSTKTYLVMIPINQVYRSQHEGHDTSFKDTCGAGNKDPKLRLNMSNYNEDKCSYMSFMRCTQLGA